MNPRAALSPGGHGDVRVQKLDPKAIRALQEAKGREAVAAGQPVPPARTKAIPKSVTWRATARIRLHSGQVTQKETFSRSGAAEARARLNALLADPDTYASRSIQVRSELRLRKEMTLAEFVAVWIATERDLGDIAPQTLNEYERIAKKDVLAGPFGIGQLRLKEVTVQVVSELITTILHGSETQRGRPSVAKQARVVLSNTFNLAVQRGLAASSPVRDATTVTIRTKRPRAITDDQADELRREVFNWAKTPYAANNPYADAQLLPLLIDTVIATTARPGEVLGLRWAEDVNLDGPVPTVNINGTIIFLKGGSAVEGQMSTVRQSRTKTGDEAVEVGRDLVIPKSLAVALRARRAQNLPGPFVFGHKHGHPLAQTSMRILWRAAIAGTTVEGMTPRTARKLGATRIAHARGVDAAAEQMGNTREIAEKHYVERRRLHDNSDILGALIGEILEPEQLALQQLWIGKLAELRDAAETFGIEELHLAGVPARQKDDRFPLVLEVHRQLDEFTVSQITAAALAIFGAPASVSVISMPTGVPIVDPWA